MLTNKVKTEFNTKLYHWWHGKKCITSSKFQKMCFLQTIKKEESQESFTLQTMHTGKSGNMLIMFI